MAIICTLNRNLTRENNCNYSLQEVKMVYLAAFEDVSATSVTYDEDPTSGKVQVDSITMVDGKKFHKIDVAKGSASYQDELVVTDQGGKYRTHTVTFSFNGQYNNQMPVPFDALSLGKFITVVYTADGQYLMLGRTIGLEAETATNQGGSDQNGITIVLSGNITESAYPLADTAISTVTNN